MKVFLNHCYCSKIVFSCQLNNVADKQGSTARTAYRITMEYSLSIFLMQCLLLGCILPRLYTSCSFQGQKTQRTLVKDKYIPHSRWDNPAY